MSAKARLELTHGGRVARLVLAAPKANILDGEMMAGLSAHCAALRGRRDLAAVVIAADGPHFSFGASVEEHLPDRIGGALGALHQLLRDLVDLPAPTLVAVRGQCLGGALELALACDIIVAEEGAQLGCPEIKLGVFPPAASALLPLRVGLARATAWMLTGDSIAARDALASGLVARVAPAGGLDAMTDEWLQQAFLSRSGAALRIAADVLRRDVRRALDGPLAEAERVYLDRLMQEPDAVEGIRAFLEKRAPRWQDGTDPG